MTKNERIAREIIEKTPLDKKWDKFDYDIIKAILDREYPEGKEEE